MTQPASRTETDPRAFAAPSASARSIEGIYPSPGYHWVGDGFRVAGYFSAIPNAMRRLDPFLLLDYHPEHHYSPTPKPRGVGVHPHRGFETVTLAFQGSVAHHDSTGAGGVIGPGDVQWMTAASGILHKEYHEAEWARRGGPMQMAQLWVNLPRANKNDPPGYQGIVAADIPEVRLPSGAGTVRVIAGEAHGARGPARTFTPMSVLHVRATAGGEVAFELPPTYNAAVLVMAGSATLGDGQRVSQHDFVIFAHDGARLALEAAPGTELLVLAGEPIDEPIAAYGPFVMNTREEIVEAARDFERGKYGTLED